MSDEVQVEQAEAVEQPTQAQPSPHYGEDYVKSLQKEAKKHRLSAKQAQEELATLRAELDGLKATRTQEAHKAKFAEVAKAKGYREDALEAAWTLSAYKPAGDPDEAALEALLGEVGEKHPYLLRGQEQPAAYQPGPGYSRGTTEGEMGLFTIRESELSTVLISQRAGAYREAVAKGTVRVIPG